MNVIYLKCSLKTSDKNTYIHTQKYGQLWFLKENDRTK